MLGLICATAIDDHLEPRLPAMLPFRDVHKNAVALPSTPVPRRGLALLLAAALVGVAVPEAQACTSFGFPARGPQGTPLFLMAKNYDWMLGDGLVVRMPAGRGSAALVASALGLRDEGFTWSAQYGSLAFTQFGVGLTISGMNDAGLAVETLVDATGVLPTNDAASRGGKRSLLSLQWVQYELDTAATIDELVASLAQVRIVQAFMPLHFLACDAGGACAVVETDAAGRSEVVRQTAAAAPLTLANRDWRRDDRDAKLWYAKLPWPTLERSSTRRFAAVSEALAGATAFDASVAGAFGLLETVSMPITRWQIVWNLSAKTAHWRHADARGARARVVSAALDASAGGCSVDTWQAATLNSRSGALPLRPMARAQIDAVTRPLFRRSMQLLAVRTLDSSLDAAALAAAVATMQGRVECP